MVSRVGVLLVKSGEEVPLVWEGGVGGVGDSVRRPEGGKERRVWRRRRSEEKEGVLMGREGTFEIGIACGRVGGLRLS